MTIKELYEWAVINHAEDLEIEIQYRYGHEYPKGTDNNVIHAVTSIKGKKVVLL